MVCVLGLMKLSHNRISFPFPPFIMFLKGSGGGRLRYELNFIARQCVHHPYLSSRMCWKCLAPLRLDSMDLPHLYGRNGDGGFKRTPVLKSTPVPQVEGHSGEEQWLPKNTQYQQTAFLREPAQDNPVNQKSYSPWKWGNSLTTMKNLANA